MRNKYRQLLPLIKWPGGKRYLVPHIIPLLSPHRFYVEPFAGGLNVLWNKPRSAVEVVSDLELDLINLYRVARDHPLAFAAAARALLYVSGPDREATFYRAKTESLVDPIERAALYMFRVCMSRGADGRSRGRSGRLRGKQNKNEREEYENAWVNRCKRLESYGERLRGVEILNRPAIEVIREYDGPDTVIYADPPYVHSTRTHRKAYRFEMTDADHLELLEVLGRCQGRVILSGYPSGLYEQALAGWVPITVDMPNHAGQQKTKGRRQEALWIKPGVGDHVLTQKRLPLADRW
jgi:DNA adenine methylase